MKCLIIIVFLLITSGFFPLRSFAQIPTITLTPAPVNTSSSYQLPYPGILPDSPLYVVKVLRDKIIGFLISDPLTRADFDLLQADKRLSASVYVQKFSPQKQEIIVSTVSKAENYFEEALGQIDLAKKQGIDVRGELGKLLVSNKKHKQVIMEIASHLSTTYQQQIIAEENRGINFGNNVTMQLLKK